MINLVCLHFYSSFQILFFKVIFCLKTEYSGTETVNVNTIYYFIFFFSLFMSHEKEIA